MRRTTLTLFLICVLVCVAAVPTFKSYAADPTQSYTVQVGDNLYRISLKFGVAMADLQQANNISDSSLIYVGQVLKIPGGASGNPVNSAPAPAPAAVPAVPAAPAPAAPGSYVVQPGDNLAQLAVRFNTTVAAIQQANQLGDPNRINVGQVLQISGAPPGGAPAAANAPAAPVQPSVSVSAGSVAAYPVVPVISGGIYLHARQLVAAGRQAGNRLNVFSKVGDSITASGYYLVPIGAGGLRIGGYSNLQGVVNFFSQTTARTNNSFANTSIAAASGWTTSDVLNPGAAPSGVCQSGETPLDCELRVTRPSVALIMFGANDVARLSLDQFRYNLNAIVTITERHGVIPVLSTTLNRMDYPDLSGRIASYNAAIVQTALAHSDPLWNYWLAASGLPNSGLGGDRLHPSVPGDQNTAIFDSDHLSAGATMRNLTALEVLNALYATVLR